MTKKHRKILKYIKKHPECSTADIRQKYKKNVDIIVLDLIEDGYCRGIKAGSFDFQYDYINITITGRGHEALKWSNYIPFIKDIASLIKAFSI